MNNELRNLLGEEIKAEIQDLAMLQAGSNEKSAAIEGVAKLYKLIIEDTKNELDFTEKCERRAMENEHHIVDTTLKEQQINTDVEHRGHDKQLREEQLSEQVKDRYFKIATEAAGLVLPLIFYAIWMKRGFKFEENGTYTSTTFKGLFNRFNPIKK